MSTVTEGTAATLTAAKSDRPTPIGNCDNRTMVKEGAQRPAQGCSSELWVLVALDSCWLGRLRERVLTFFGVEIG